MQKKISASQPTKNKIAGTIRKHQEKKNLILIGIMGCELIAIWRKSFA